MDYRYDIVPYTRGRGLSIGGDKVYPHFMTLNHENAEIICDCENLDLFTSKSMDFVFSNHPAGSDDKALRAWWRVVKNDGHLVLYFSDNDLASRDVMLYMENVGYWDLVFSEQYTDDQDNNFLQIYKKLSVKKHSYSFSDEKPEKTCCLVRYGGIGDHIMASSVFPGLKDQGYHLTVNTNPNGYEILKHNPFIDKFIIQDQDQVPNLELFSYWSYLSQKYDKFINLSESVEGTFLVIPGRPVHGWPKGVRDDLLDVNYLELTHGISGTPYTPEQKFYSTEKERARAKKRVLRMGGNVITWVLSGSSVHKVWPYLDAAIARIMMYYPDYKVVFIGDQLSQILEHGWANEPRVIKKCGIWGIRESLAFAEYSSMVIGPQTGIMPAVSMLNMPKMMFLSHSTVENISRDWVNCFNLIPENCHCYCCHMMHYGFEHCPRDEETGVSLCQAKISLEQFWDTFNMALQQQIAA